MRPKVSKRTVLFVLLMMGTSLMSMPLTITSAGEGYKDFKIEKHLWGKQGGEFITWSPDGKYIVSQASSIQQTDFSFKYWKMEEGWDSVEVPTQHEGIIFCFEWSPDSKYIATAFRSVIVYDVNAGWSPKPKIGYDNAIIRDLSWDSSGKKLAVGNEVGEIYIIDTATWTIVSNFTAFGQWIEDVEYSPDGSMLAASNQEGIIRIYDTASWNLKWEFTSHKGPVKGLAWGPNNDLLISSSFDSSIFIWDIVAGKFKMKLGGHGQDVTVYDVKWNFKSNMIVTCGDKEIRVWDGTTWDLQQAIVNGYSDTTASAITVSWHPDGERFVASGWESVDIWSQHVKDPIDSDKLFRQRLCGGVFVVILAIGLSYGGYSYWRSTQEGKEEEEVDEDEDEEDYEDE